MSYPYHSKQYYFDIYPKVVKCGKETEIRIRSLGKTRFETGETYSVEFTGLDCGMSGVYPASADETKGAAYAENETTVRLLHTFEKEQEYSVVLYDTNGRRVERLSVYCVEGDLAERLPYLGDLHLHSCRSDGGDLPEVVASNYRAYGYDFLALTDHMRYYPSLEAMDFCAGIHTGLLCMPGEEIHLPAWNGKRLEQHIVAIGAEYSINAMIEGPAIEEKGDDPRYRSLHGECPDVMTAEAFGTLMEDLSKKENLPDNIDAYPFAQARWTFDQIRKAGGLGIWVHPNWLQSAYHTPEVFSDELVKNRLFDAFEVLGGERYYEQNGYQTLRYYDDKAKGYRYPIVGSTDSHSSYPNNAGGFICATVIFSKAKECGALLDAVRDFYSVAVDTISKEYRLVGEPRLARYTAFLLREYFPYHDDLCREEGRLMRQYAVGTEEEKAEAKELLLLIGNRTEKLMKKYFDFA